MAAPDVPPIRVPDSFTVWAASDLHGQRRAFDRLLAAGGLTDGEDRWIAPPATALVITGDVVDRGPDSLGLVRRLASLRDQAAATGSLVAILEGNHEMQALGGLDGHPMLFRALMASGGGATLRSVGLRPHEWEGRSPEDVRARVDELAPDLVPALWSFAPYARWRDVLFVHGGPVPHVDLHEFERGAERLWIRSGFLTPAEPFPDGPSWASYREAGIRRVVFGHTPVASPELLHDGHALNLDTWRGGHVTLVQLPLDGNLEAAHLLAEPAEARSVADAPVSAEDIRRFETGLPAIVDAWIEVRFGSRSTD